MAKKKKHAEHENLERWLISYADFITLLFAFFVVMWSMRTDNPPSKPVIEGIKRAFNVFGEKSAAQEVKVSLSTGGGAESVFTAEPMYQSIVESLKDAGVKGVSVHKVERGIVIRIPDEALFNPGQAIIREDYKKALDKTAAILAAIPNPIQIEGHTDNVPIQTSQYPSNWELSTARAIALMRHFTERSGLPPGKFSIAGYSEYQPVASNDTPQGRSKNRRVDIVVVKQEGGKNKGAPPVNTDAFPTKPVAPPMPLPAQLTKQAALSPQKGESGTGSPEKSSQSDIFSGQPSAIEPIGPGL